MRKTFIISLLICLTIGVYSQSSDTVSTSDSIKTQDLLNLSLEDLMNLEVKVQVSSTEGEVIFKTPSTISIFDKQMIENFNIQSVAELLEFVVGMSVHRTYLKRQLPTSRGILQDHYANKVLVLINGVPSFHAITGEGNIDRIHIQDIERVEVLRGPASVLYGTNAYSGAVNIVLNTEQSGSMVLYTGAGTGKAMNMGGNTFIQQGDFKAFVGVSSKHEDGVKISYKDEKEVEKKLNEYINTSSMTMQSYYKSHSLLFNAYSSQESYLGVVNSFASGAGNPHYVKGVLANYQFQKKISKHFLKLGLTGDLNNRNISRTADDAVRTNIEGYRILSSGAFIYTITDYLNFELGGSFEYRYSDEYRNYDVFTGKSVTTVWTGKTVKDTLMILDGKNGLSDLGLYEHSEYGQLKFQKGRFVVLGGSRITNNQLFKQDISSRVTGVFSINDKNSIKAIYGESFRAPAFFETHFFLNTVLGNKDLRPEKSKSYELSYLSSIKRLFFQVTAYYAEYSNKIVRQSVIYELNNYKTKTIMYQNSGFFSAKGIEYEMKYVNPKVINTFVTYSFVDGSKSDNVKEMLIEKQDTIYKDNYNFLYVPKHELAIGISRTIKNFGISCVANYWSPIMGYFRPIAEQYFINAGISYKHNLGSFVIRHELVCKNITDAKIVYPEYTRREVVNAVPDGHNRFIGYTLKLRFSI
ncbi:MAG: TonB-dependent receptor [Bacteroidales bacterium]